MSADIGDDKADFRRRGVNLGLCILVGLASGSNYVYSAWAPQLASRLDLTSTIVNLVGLAGNFGVYATGPIWGKMIDSRGQRVPLLAGGISCLSGYLIVRLYVLKVIALRSPSAAPHSPPSVSRMALLLVAMFLTGTGGCAGLAAAVNATAKSFSDKVRGSATGAVIAGFGLSAFTFSTLGHVFFAGDAAGLLALLAVGTGLPMIIGSFFIRSMPPTEVLDNGHENRYRPIRETPEIVFDSEARASTDVYQPSPSIELIRSRSPHTHSQSPSRNTLHSSVSSLTTSTGRNTGKSIMIKTDYVPSELISHPHFLAIFAILAILCGTGLMYINNVGTVALALGREGRREYDAKEVSLWQSRNVGLVSIWNCLGRIIGGILSDFSKSRLQLQRVWFLPIISALFILSQLAALAITSVHSLWVISTILGGAYGAMFNVMPMLVLEWFGMSHFSQNYGWICVAPVIGGNLFNIVFGRVYDSHTLGKLMLNKTPTGTNGDLVRSLLSSRAEENPQDSTHDCLLGSACYSSAFGVSALGCVIALGISLALAWSREKEDKKRRVLAEMEEEEEESLGE